MCGMQATHLDIVIKLVLFEVNLISGGNIDPLNDVHPFDILL